MDQRNDMRGIRSKRIIVLLLCVSLSGIWAAQIRSGAGAVTEAIDFAELYFGARCALGHEDPYNPANTLRRYEAVGGKLPTDGAVQRKLVRDVIAVDFNLPTALFVIAPFAMLPWTAAQTAWFGSAALLLVLAAYLMWQLAEDAPALAGCVLGFMLLNCVVVLAGGNPAGLVVPLTVIAAWCWLKERFALAGVAALAVCLVLKPHDAGFVWLYFLLAGGTGRKRALQTLAVTAVLGIGAALWITPISPHWFHEEQTNYAYMAARGWVNDPGPTAATKTSFSPIVSLQSALSVFRDDPHFYNTVSYAIGGMLILVCVLAVLRKRQTREGSLLALGAVAALTMLPAYHRAADAKLLMLTIPACAILWRVRGARRWFALGLTGASIFVTSDVPIIFWQAATRGWAASTSTLSGKTILLMQHPAPLVLLAAGCFYLWAYVRYKPSTHNVGQEQEAGLTAAAS